MNIFIIITTIISIAIAILGLFFATNKNRKGDSTNKREKSTKISHSYNNSISLKSTSNSKVINKNCNNNYTYTENNNNYVYNTTNLYPDVSTTIKRMNATIDGYSVITAFFIFLMFVFKKYTIVSVILIVPVIVYVAVITFKNISSKYDKIITSLLITLSTAAIFLCIFNNPTSEDYLMLFELKNIFYPLDTEPFTMFTFIKILAAYAFFKFLNSLRKDARSKKLALYAIIKF